MLQARALRWQSLATHERGTTGASVQACGEARRPKTRPPAHPKHERVDHRRSSPCVPAHLPNPLACDKRQRTATCRLRDAHAAAAEPSVCIHRSVDELDQAASSRDGPTRRLVGSRSCPLLLTALALATLLRHGQSTPEDGQSGLLAAGANQRKWPATTGRTSNGRRSIF